MTKHTGRAGPHRNSYIDDTGQAGYLVTMLNPTVTTPPEVDHAGTFVILSHFDTRCGHITTRDTLCFNLVLKTNSNSCTVDHPRASSWLHPRTLPHYRHAPLQLFSNKICPHQAHNRIEFTSASTWTLVTLFLHETIHHLPHYLASSEFPCSLFAAKTPSDNSGSMT